VSGVVVAETMRRHLTSIAFWSFLALLAIFAMGGGNMGGGRMWPMLVLALAVVTGGGVIGPEFSSGTLQLILVKPVNRAVYLLSRVAGVVAITWLAAVAAAGFEAAGAALDGRTQWTAIGIALSSSFADSLLIVALLAFFGSVTRAYYNVVIWVGAQLLLLILLAFGARRFPPELLKAIRWVHGNLFPETPSGFDRNWLLLVACNAAIALLLACLAFRNREVPYGAD